MFETMPLPPNIHYHTLSNKNRLSRLLQLTLFNGKLYTNLLQCKKVLMQDALLIYQNETEYFIPFNQISIMEFDD